MAGKPNVPQPYKDKAWLYQKYTIEKRTAEECAELAGCFKNTIYRWLKKHQIEARTNPIGEDNPMWGRTKEKHHNFNSVLKTCPVCGKTFYVPKYDLDRRITCSRKCKGQWWKITQKQAGENNPHWLGGIDYRRGQSWSQVRDEVRLRDNYKCTVCGITEVELGQELDVHHILPYRTFDNDIEANHSDNLVCMCKSCHTVADREYCRLEKLGAVQRMAGLPSVIKSVRWLDKTLPKLNVG